jgi:hypothetical protein
VISTVPPEITDSRNTAYKNTQPREAGNHLPYPRETKLDGEHTASQMATKQSSGKVNNVNLKALVPLFSSS